MKNKIKYTKLIYATLSASMIFTVIAQCWWTKDYICATGTYFCSNNNPIPGWSREYIVPDGYLPECATAYQGFSNCDNVPDTCVQDPAWRITYDALNCPGNAVQVEKARLTSQGHSASLWGAECGVASSKNNTRKEWMFAHLLNEYRFVSVIFGAPASRRF
jgi:hypothetical protein